MICYVYRSNRKRDTYLYLKDKGDFECLPDTVLKIFGPPEFSLSFQIDKDRKLAQADTEVVIDTLEADGFYLQLPRSDYDLLSIEQQIVDSLDTSK
jgi:uncharacterized protein YcgL (UPF0745 family)